MNGGVSFQKKSTARILSRSPAGSEYPRAYTELLRLGSPVQATARTATTDHHIVGVPIAKGDPVVVCLAAANRDPHAYPDPE